MTSRIHRGFHRIGIVLAALACILVVWALVQGDQFAALILFAAAIALYATARAVGWVLDGIMGQIGRDTIRLKHDSATTL